MRTGNSKVINNCKEGVEKWFSLTSKLVGKEMN
jgi:hypothetical protein